MSFDDYTDAESISGLIQLIELFKRVLADKVAIFKETQDAAKFQKGIAYLRRDLHMFTEIFDVSYQDAKTAQEYAQLEILAKSLAKIRDLICKAEQLL